MSRSGAEVLCGRLEALGATHVFGLPGTQNVALFEALRRSRLHTVLATHELAAGFMANGFARASGRVGVLFTIPGPGFTFALTALAEARLDSAPLLHVVGRPARSPGRRFQHQAIPQREMVEPLVKRVIEVDDPGGLVAGADEAWHAALGGEPGPVVLHLGAGVMEAEAAEPSGPPRAPAPPDRPEGWRAALVGQVRGARRPVLLLGQGAAAAGGSLVPLAERLGAPVVTTPSGRGIVPEDHPLATGFDLLRTGLGPFNALVEEADLVLALGCKLGHNGSGGFGMTLPREKLVHVDTSAEVLGANYEADRLVQATVEAVVEALDGLEPTGSTWSLDEVARWRERLGHPDPDRGPAEPAFPSLDPPTAAAFFQLLDARLDPATVVVTDSGLHQVLTRRHHVVRAPRGLITPADFQSMAFGLPAAIGASLARGGAPVVAVIGDGGLAMSAMELLTAVREELPIKVVVFKDGVLNLIRMQQIRDWGRTHAVELLNPEMAGLAAALGADYALLGEEPAAVLDEALGSRRATLIEVRLGDSPAVRSQMVRAGARAAVRRALPRRVIDLMKGLVGR